MDDTLLTGVATGVATGAMLSYVLLSLVVMVFNIIIMWKIFTKAGHEGWKSIVPIYNLIVLAQIAGMNPLLLLCLLIPCVGAFVVIYMYYKLGCKFGSKTYGILCAIPCTTWIALIMIAFSNNIEYNFED